MVIRIERPGMGSRSSWVSSGFRFWAARRRSPVLRPTKIRALAIEPLGTNYLVTPQMTVTMKEYRSRPISVLGNVQRGGVFLLQKNFVTLTAALSLAGGLSERACPTGEHRATPPTRV